MLAIFGYQLLSSAVSQLLDYIVWERAAARYPDSLGLTRFMGFFGVVINVVTIVFVGVFAGRLLTRFGVGVGLWANPAGVLMVLIIAAVAGSVGRVAGRRLLRSGLRRTGGRHRADRRDDPHRDLSDIPGAAGRVAAARADDDRRGRGTAGARLRRRAAADLSCLSLR